MAYFLNFRFIKPVPKRPKDRSNKVDGSGIGSGLKVIKYGEKFKFDAVLLGISDFQISFWTNVKLSNESVIYPKNSDKRWWKISGSEPKFNGNIYYGKISDLTPNFED